MKRLLIIPMLLLGVLVANAAEAYNISKEALAVLDKASALYRDKGDMEIDMKIVFKDDRNKSENSAKGVLKATTKKFLLQTDFATMLFDGKYMYVYTPDAEELTITEPEQDDISGMNPTAILDTYKKDFKIPDPEIVKLKSGNAYSIDLFPEDLNAEYIKLNIKIDQNDYSIKSVSTVTKNGITNTIEINKITTGLKFAPETFVFSGKYPNATVIDLR